MTIPVSEFDALLRSDFYAFLERVYYQVSPQGPFQPNWHLELLAAKLEACRRGECRRLLLLVPPRSLKSISASVALPAYWLGHDPAAQLMCVSYAQELADKLARDTRSVLHAPWYRRLFPTRLARDRQALAELATTRGGFRLATSVGGVLTGRGADVILIDDPLKPEQAYSEAERKRVNDWYQNTLYSRLNDKRTGVIILVMQRLHEDDLAGHVLEQEDWDVVALPAIALEDERHTLVTPYGRRVVTRREGEALHPEREPLETLAEIRKTLGEVDFSAQYLQTPVPRGGAIVKEVWFPRFAVGELPERLDGVLQSWDTANKAGELNDFSVCTTWAIKGKHLYLLHVFRKQLNYPDLKRAAREQAQLHNATVVLIEDRASGTQLIQELASEGFFVNPYRSADDKVMRLHAQSAKIENGFVHLPKEAPWLADYLHELLAFPSSKYKDQVDSTTQALDWFGQSQIDPSSVAWRELQKQGPISTGRRESIRATAGYCGGRSDFSGYL